MKFKKLSLIMLSTFSLSGIAYADNSSTPFQGFYAELGAGGINSQFDVNQNSYVSVDEWGQNTSVNLPSNTKNYSNGGIGNIGFGYMYVIGSSIVLGTEISADIENAKTTNNDSVVANPSNFNLSNTTTNKLKNSFAIQFKPGYLFNQGNTLVYGLIGPRWGNFETTSSTTFQSDDYPNASGSSSNSQSGYEFGLSLGAGIQQYLTDGLSIGIEYQYTDYGNISTPSSSGPVAFANPTALSAPVPATGSVGNNISSIKAKTNALTVNLMYHF